MVLRRSGLSAEKHKERTQQDNDQKKEKKNRVAPFTSLFLNMTTATENLNSIVATQLESLDDTDCYASAWADAIQAANESHEIVSWGGRGKGGRGLSRRTFQPHSVSLENVRLEYVSETGLPGKVLLDAAPLKIRSQRVYALVGRNGCGKSTLLRRIDAGKIPGFPLHLSSMYIPQEVVPEPDKTPLDFVLRHHNLFLERSKDASKSRIESLEAELEGLDMTSEDDTQRMEELCEEISMIQDISDGHDLEVVQQQAQGALAFFGINKRSRNIPMERLSGGERKKVVLACALFCPTDLVLLDEPTNFLDVEGLVELRRFISTCTDRNSIVILVSHDVDLINDVATDVIYFHNQTLTYYPGNYRDFVGYKRQHDLHFIRENAALVKKRDAMMQTIDNLKKQPIPKRGGAKKKGRAIESVKKKLEKEGLTRDEKGHRWTSQTAGTGRNIDA
jgi:ATPase subunit of ABC transporter with duplicated ATPase domains